MKLFPSQSSLEKNKGKIVFYIREQKDQEQYNSPSWLKTAAAN